MPTPRLVLVVLFSALASAQQPEPQVQDLLLSEGQDRLVREADFVSRALWWLNGHEEGDRRHGVSGEGHLSPGRAEYQESPEPRGIFTEDSLAAALAALRGADEGSARFERVGGEVLLISEYPEQAATALTALRRRIPPRIEVDVRLERITRGTVTTVLSGSQTFLNGEVRVLADLERRRVLHDFDVEIAQAAATANPIIGEIDSGASISLRARSLPFHDEAVLEVVLRTATRLPVQPFLAHPALGPLEGVSSRVDEAGLTFRVGRDQPVQHEWSTLDGDRLRLTCTARWQAPPAGDADPQVVCSSLFGAPVLGFRSTTAEEPEEVSEAFWGRHLVERSSSTAGVRLFEPGDTGGGGVLLLEGDGGRRVARQLGARFDAALRTARVTVEVFDIAEGVEVPTQGGLPDGARPIARLSGPITVGLPACFASARERSYLRDWDVEVAQSSRIPDPKIDMVEAGWFATVRAVRDPDGSVDRLELALDMDSLEEVRVADASINAAMTALASVTDDSRAPAVWLPQDVLSIELPVVRSLRVASTLRLDQAGTAVLRRSAATYFGPGRELVVRAKVDVAR